MRQIGRGAFRTVFEHPDRPEDWVVKVPRKDVERHGRVMNQEEARAARLFPDLFPAVHDPDPDALVVDRANPVDDLTRYFPSIKRVHRKFPDVDPWVLLREALLLLTGDAPVVDTRKRLGVLRSMLRRVAQEDPNVLRLRDAVQELEISVKDICKQNTGVSRRTGRFVLVDASTMPGFRG